MIILLDRESITSNGELAHIIKDLVNLNRAKFTQDNKLNIEANRSNKNLYIKLPNDKSRDLGL
jgi:hypothetical protein